jgi:hypothetical protein
MDDLQVQRQPQRAVWNTAVIAVAVFMVIVFFAGLFGSPEVIAVASGQ